LHIVVDKNILMYYINLKVKRLTISNMSATIKDVAKLAKVSVATVSLVIHNNKRISPETRKRVLKAIKELNYHPTRLARGLVSKKSGNIGFILTEDHFSRTEPFYTQIFLGTEFKAREEEYYILLTTVSSNFNEKDSLPRFVLEKNVDGVILAGKVPLLLINGLKKYNLPIVFVDYYPPNGDFPAVLIDNLSGGFKATNHLIECKHTRIGFVAGDIQHPSIKERFQGYRMALENAGIPFDPRLTITDEPYPARENGYRAAKKLLSQAPDVTAIFTCNDAMAIGVLRYLKETSRQVPKDISLIGFDDVEADLSLDPPLTTMRVPKVELGIEAINLMMEILKKGSMPARKILVPVELVVRRSTCDLA